MYSIYKSIITTIYTFTANFHIFMNIVLTALIVFMTQGTFNLIVDFNRAMKQSELYRSTYHESALTSKAYNRNLPLDNRQ